MAKRTYPNSYFAWYNDDKRVAIVCEDSAGHGLDTGMQQARVCYMKARMFEDSGDIQRGQYYRQMYEKAIKQYPSRKSGIRALAVPRI